MSKKSGCLVQFKNSKGELRKGIALHKEQRAAFANHGKSFIRLVNDDFEPLLDDNGKKLVSVKNSDECIIIGYID